MGALCSEDQVLEARFGASKDGGPSFVESWCMGVEKNLKIHSVHYENFEANMKRHGF